MTTALETAFPSGTNLVRNTIVAKLAEAFIPVFSSPTITEDFTVQPYRAIAIYGPDGDLELYAYDAGDTTTADDGGVTCIVVSGRRYKKRIDVIIRDSALSATTDAQPGSPTLGDTYILTAAQSGTDWASEAKAVATFTARGWIFRDPFVGMTVYVEDEDAFYHYDSNGDWVLGMGTGAVADGSLTPKKLFHPFAILKVVDQRNSPPGGTPVDGTMYQVGTSPTGAFAAHANDIARWNGSGWEFLDAEEGDTIYRLDEGVLYTFRSGAWGASYAPASVFKFYTKSVTSSASNSSGTPTNIATQSIQAPAGSLVRVSMTAVDANNFNISNQYQVGVRIDTASTFAALMCMTGGLGGILNVPYLSTVVSVPDASAHDYSLAMRRAGGSGSMSLSSVRLIVTWEVISPNT